MESPLFLLRYHYEDCLGPKLQVAAACWLDKRQGASVTERGVSFYKLQKGGLVDTLSK